MLISKLNRIFKRDNMGFPVGIYGIDDRCKSGRLSASGMTDDAEEFAFFDRKVQVLLRSS